MYTTPSWLLYQSNCLQLEVFIDYELFNPFLLWCAAELIFT